MQKSRERGSCDLPAERRCCGIDSEIDHCVCGPGCVVYKGEDPFAGNDERV